MTSIADTITIYMVFDIALGPLKSDAAVLPLYLTIGATALAGCHWIVPSCGSCAAFGSIAANRAQEDRTSFRAPGMWRPRISFAPTWTRCSLPDAAPWPCHGSLSATHCTRDGYLLRNSLHLLCLELPRD
ncbi:hypothetical protein FIBSPDRAFT_164700 [Athelia psychrophila]|uniref:Uncharacterized protein n=1 Tax=Athelia psychrophila TaxID=1759441 RepID=A0A166B6G4_9AGAM|nr:hypothetical protein FIBSPDRAFT_164700 [Fibularhizoctonia sp. CBS 109695]